MRQEDFEHSSLTNMFQNYAGLNDVRLRYAATNASIIIFAIHVEFTPRWSLSLNSSENSYDDVHLGRQNYCPAPNGDSVAVTIFSFLCVIAVFIYSFSITRAVYITWDGQGRWKINSSFVYSRFFRYFLGARNTFWYFLALHRERHGRIDAWRCWITGCSLTTRLIYSLLEYCPCDGAHDLRT